MLNYKFVLAKINIDSYYTDTDSSALSMFTNNGIEDLQKFEDLFDFSNLNKNHELFSKKNTRVFMNFELKLLNILFWMNLFL